MWSREVRETIAPDTPGEAQNRRTPPNHKEGAAVSAFPQEEQFADFYRSSVPRIMAYLMYRGASSSEAADATQEAMTRLLSRWTSVAHPYTWTRTTARHVYVEHLRRREDIVTGDVPDLPDIQVAKDIDDMINRHSLITLLNQLPTMQRTIMALSLDGDSPVEIAEELKISPATVRSNLRHARHRVRSLMSELALQRPDEA